MNYKFIKEIGEQTFLGKKLKSVAVCSTLQYFPEAKEIHVSFLNLLLDKKTGETAYNNSKEDTKYVNVTAPEPFAAYEDLLINSGVVPMLEQVYADYEAEILRKFGMEAPYEPEEEA